MSFFNKDKKEGKHVTKGIKKVDTIITGLVLGGILASVYGIKKYEDSKKDSKPEQIEKKDSKTIPLPNEKKADKRDGILKIIFKIILKKALGKK
ncbi:MAG: hypothetical protein PHS92_02995 [Candidatus Gracilibacteria bacterium]|nr:hypothetical protein [Candidatus Gracilibacteria bacterium]